VHINNQEDFYLGCNVGLRVKGEKWTNVLRFVQLIAKKTMEQPRIVQIIIININTLTPYNKVLPTIYKGNKLIMPFIYFFIFFWFFSFLNFIFVDFFLFSLFFLRIIKMIKSKGIILQTVNSQPYTFRQPKKEEKQSSQYTNITKANTIIP